jgi:HAD superfamily hydrolase (TIGR01456 family)
VAHPEAWPFDALLDTVYKDVARPLPKPLWAPGQALEDSLKIDAIMVMHDPRDWAWEIQLFTDLLQSRDGILGTYSDRNGDPDLPNHGWQQDGQPKVYFSNSDLYWVTDFPLRRFGQGAFQHAFAGVWERITGGEHELERELYGKPYGVTYQYAEDMLRQFRRDMLTNVGHDELGDLKRVYMVGDNPDSDIAGANNHVSKYGTKWSSILIGTGVWNEQRDGMRKLIGDREPTAIQANVLEAVRWGLDNEGWKHHL